MDEAPAETDAWQQRFEVLAALALVACVSSSVAFASQIYVAERITHQFADGGIDWGAVLRAFGRGAGPASGALVVASFLLVAWGPGDRIERLGSRVLQATVVVGLIVAVAAGFVALDVLITGTGSVAMGGVDGSDASALTSAIARVGTALPLLASVALAGLGAWCAFATLGDVPPAPVIAEGESDLGVAAEGEWTPPPAT